MGQAIRDVYEGNPNARLEVMHWLKSKDFEIVCDFAYVDADQMMEQIATLLTLPLPLAKKYGRILRLKVMEGVHNNDP